jgi:hypothetical protein
MHWSLASARSSATPPRTGTPERVVLDMLDFLGDLTRHLS